MAGANTGSAGKPSNTQPIKAAGANTGSAGKPTTTKPVQPVQPKK